MYILDNFMHWWRDFAVTFALRTYAIYGKSRTVLWFLVVSLTVSSSDWHETCSCQLTHRPGYQHCNGCFACPWYLGNPLFVAILSPFLPGVDNNPNFPVVPIQRSTCCFTSKPRLTDDYFTALNQRTVFSPSPAYQSSRAYSFLLDPQRMTLSYLLSQASKSFITVSQLWI